MFISMNWIKDYVDLSGLDVEALIHRFTLSTAEVEEIIIKGNDLKEVVSAKIISVENHPKSKKLHLLKVDAGDKIYDVVCGAPNVREGLVVPFVKEGGMVGGNAIEAVEIAGYLSHGMCCSEAELGISDDHAGLMELPSGTSVGVDIKELYEIGDIIFEVDNKSLTNRPDLWGHYGIAREFAAISGRRLLPVDCCSLSEYDSLPEIDIDLKDSENCLRYSGLKVGNVKEKFSPVNMRIRLFYCGSRAINLLADLTNYLMLELGQPMHAFDCSKVDCIEVQRFDRGFEFRTLDGESREIDKNTLMITSKGEPVAIAGIMGGLATEIEDETDSLLLESANFDAVCIRKSSTRLGLRTDASMRYEKTLDPEMTVTAIARFVRLLKSIDGGITVTSSLTDKYPKKYPSISLSFDKSYVDRYTGIDIKHQTIMDTLTSLGFGVSYGDKLYNITVPSWRATKDVTMKADIIEEISRIYGYDNFKLKTTVSPLTPVRRSSGNLRDNYCKDILAEHFGLHEVNSYIWNDSKKLRAVGIEPAGNVRLLNAMTPEHDTIRNCIVPSLLTFIPQNRSYATEYGIFEIARVVEGLCADGLCNERKKLGVVLYSRSKSEKELYFELLDMVTLVCKQILHKNPVFEKSAADHAWQHPANTASVSIDGCNLGFACTVHPTPAEKLDKKAAVVTAQLDMDSFTELVADEIVYETPSKYPGIDIDLSILVSEDVKFSDIAPGWNIPGMPLKAVSLIDSFDHEGKKSITLRFSLLSDTHTLSMEEVQPYVDTVVANLSKKGISLKS